MKKLIAFALASILTLSLTACGGGASSTASSAAAASTAASASTASSAAESTGSSTSTDGATPTLDAIKEKGTFTLMTATGFPPFEYLGADGQPAGVDIDVGKLVADGKKAKRKAHQQTDPNQMQILPESTPVPFEQ